MTLTLLGLMAYFLTGQAVHEWLGAAALALRPGRSQRARKEKTAAGS